MSAPGAPSTGAPSKAPPAPQQQQQTVPASGKNVSVDAEISQRYVVGGLLGSGSYGSVFEATDRLTKQVVAIKIIARNRLGNGGEAKIEKEVGVMKVLDHPRILHMHDYMASANHYNIIMEKVDGGELFQHLLHVKKYTEKKACRVIFNLLRALKHMHEKHIMHSDIKPENLLLVKKPVTDEEVTNIKLADFGLATVCKAPDFATKACGSPLYIAPEVLECGLNKTRKCYTEAADLWSVGVMTYLLVSGLIPFFGKTPNEIFKTVLYSVHNFNHKAWEPVSPEAKDFINRLLVKNPDERMTVKQALQHPWMQLCAAQDDDEDVALPETLEGLKTFNAQQKLRGAMFGVEATFRLAYLGKCNKSNMKPNSKIVEVLTSATEKVEEIDISGNYLGGKGLLILVDSLTSLASANVRILNLKNTLLSDGELEQLIPYLCRPSCIIHTLDVSENTLTHAGGRLLLDLARARAQYTSVKADRNHIKESILRKLDEQCVKNLSLLERSRSRSSLGAGNGSSPPPTGRDAGTVGEQPSKQQQQQKQQQHLDDGDTNSIGGGSSAASARRPSDQTKGPTTDINVSQNRGNGALADGSSPTGVKDLLRQKRQQQQKQQV